ncbi:helix-turn-helix domain-containing protein [Zunongwangia sp.]|uniref:helix-turn-helix domain-containing protein n=1 Tax=Zunongwangia sp. TaxID=1965325 RepID=UPI003AA88FF2
MNKSDIYSTTTEIEYLNMDTHLHEEHHQLIFMIKGTLHITVDKKQYFLPERFIGLIPAKCAHNLQSRNERVKMFLIYFPNSIKLEQFLPLTSNSFVLENLLYISQQSEQLNKKKHLELYNFTYSFLEMIKTIDSLQSFPLKGFISSKNERLQNVLSFIDKNYQEQINLTQIADKFGFSVRNLTRLFKKEMMSFTNYLNHVRIIHAIELFTDYNEDIEKVGYSVGYNTLSNFSRTFKKFTGQSPTAFIKANKTSVFLDI